MLKLRIVISAIILFTATASFGLGTDENVKSVLYLGKGDNQPLVVGLGGSEGGNAWASDRWKPARNKFIDQGYAFLAVGYFGSEGTPKQLDRIEIENVYAAIQKALNHPQIKDRGVALIGGSKGAELALLLASYYPSISCVVSIVGSHVTFPALTLWASTSSWTYQGKEVPYVPMPWSAVPAAMKRDLRKAFEIMLEDKEAEKQALIKVEKIKGPVLLVSATEDEMWPSTEMSELVVQRLKENNFAYVFQHIAVKGGHLEALKHFDEIITFMGQHYPSH